MKPAWIGLGSNVGESRLLLRRATALLSGLPTTQVRAVSPSYWTAPWGEVDQPDFLNAVVKLMTDLSPDELLAQLLIIEDRLGRRRGGKRWGPRTIDLDLLVYADHQLDMPHLTVPHPRLAQRAFVLVPLSDLSPELDVPGMGKIGELLTALDKAELSGVRRTDSPEQTLPELI